METGRWTVLAYDTMMTGSALGLASLGLENVLVDSSIFIPHAFSLSPKWTWASNGCRTNRVCIPRQGAVGCEFHPFFTWELHAVLIFAFLDLFFDPVPPPARATRLARLLLWVLMVDLTSGSPYKTACPPHTPRYQMAPGAVVHTSCTRSPGPFFFLCGRWVEVWCGVVLPTLLTTGRCILCPMQAPCIAILDSARSSSIVVSRTYTCRRSPRA